MLQNVVLSLISLKNKIINKRVYLTLKKIITFNRCLVLKCICRYKFDLFAVHLKSDSIVTFKAWTIHSFQKILTNNGLSFCLFVSFSHSNYNFRNTKGKNLEGLLWIWTRGRRMVDADKTTEQWRPPLSFHSLC